MLGPGRAQAMPTTLPRRTRALQGPVRRRRWRPDAPRLLRSTFPPSGRFARPVRQIGHVQLLTSPQPPRPCWQTSPGPKQAPGSQHATPWARLFPAAAGAGRARRPRARTRQARAQNLEV